MRLLARTCGKAVVVEPTVSTFNKQIFALWWMARACSEYILMLAHTPGAIPFVVPRKGMGPIRPALRSSLASVRVDCEKMGYKSVTKCNKMEERVTVCNMLSKS